MPAATQDTDFQHPYAAAVRALNSADTFHGFILWRFYTLMHHREHDNFDKMRFARENPEGAEQFDVARHANALNWYFQHVGNLFAGFSLLNDDLSRALFSELILYRLLGHLHVRIHARSNSVDTQIKAFSQHTTGTPSRFPVQGHLGHLVDYDFEWKGARYTATLSANSMASKLVRRQYFYELGSIRIRPEEGDHFIDGGACLGDTALAFSHSVGPWGRVFSFEPNSVHLNVFQRNHPKLPHPNVAIVPYGLSHRTQHAEPVSLDDRCNHGFSVKAPGLRQDAIPLFRLDDFVAENQIERIDFVKLDIEGSELDALQGATETLQRFRPKLAISLYHKPNDLFEIPLYLKRHHPFYRFHLDHYTIHSEETVLYAIAED